MPVTKQQRWYSKNKTRADACIKAWRKKNPEKSKAYSRKWREQNKETTRRDNSRWKIKNPKKYKEVHLKQRHGITLDQRASIMDTQGCRCPGCCVEFYGWDKTWHVDHCHNTEKIRGVLCRSCNLLLGYARDSEHTLLRLCSYLESNR
jgi:hypothetical protein